MSYLAALLAHIRENPPEPGTVRHIEIHHDSDCPRLDGGPCRCSPLVESGARVERKFTKENP